MFATRVGMTIISFESLYFSSNNFVITAEERPPENEMASF